MRQYNYNILQEVKDRWSPRAFSSEPIAEDDLKALFECARYAPSCFNAQPWRFIVSHDQESLKLMQSLLLERNYLWAGKAPVLVLILSENIFEYNKKENRYGKFDTGTAWGFLALEATKRGYYSHAMAGFKHKLARELFKIPETYDVIAMVALGKPGRIEDLDETFHSGEKPNDRKPLSETMLNIHAFTGVSDE